MLQLRALKRLTGRPIYGRPIYALLLVMGLAHYLLFKRTPAFAYQSMIRLFCLTQGRSNDWLSSAIGFFKRPGVFRNAPGLLGDMADPALRGEVVVALRERGYHIFPKRLSDEVCDRLVKYATTQSSFMCPTDFQEGKWDKAAAVYRRGAPEAIRYDFKPQDLLKNPDVQRLLADLSFANLAQDYLGSRPVLDVLTMWWSTDFSDRPDSRAAQYFHFDMDRPKWLKFFIYLTDVESVNGPHCFVSGSQKTGAIPRSILRHGYARLTDEEVKSAFGDDAITTMEAPRGTIIAEDTRGLHKGTQVSRGDRLILQFQYSNTLFGATYPKASLCEPILHDLKDLTQAYPDVYAAYR